jgi:DNA modification methylase
MPKIDIINEDCFKVIQQFIENDFKVDAIITDIPYQISVDNNFKTMKDRTGRNGIDFGEWDKEFDCSSLGIFSKILKPNGSIVLFHSFEQYADVKKTFEDNGLECKDRIIWEKTNPMPRNRDRRYISNCEMGSWYVMKKAKWTFNRQDEKYQKMIFRYPSESGGGFKRYHPTQKNLELMKEIVAIHTNENDIVFDPFAGSGSTGVACKELNRNFIGCEIDENYAKIIEERINA